MKVSIVASRSHLLSLGVLIYGEKKSENIKSLQIIVALFSITCEALVIQRTLNVNLFMLNSQGEHESDLTCFRLKFTAYLQHESV